MIEFISASELAMRFGYAGANDGFRNFCREIGIRPIRRNPHFFDPVHVRSRLNEVQGIVDVQGIIARHEDSNQGNASDSLYDAWKASPR